MMRESIDGIKVIRTFVIALANRGFLPRIVNQLSFTLSCFLALPWIGRKDIVITECPPLFLGLSGIVLARIKKAKHVFNVADLWPESAVELGALKNRAFIWISNLIASTIYKLSDLITTTTKGQLESLLARGIASQKLLCIPNGVDTTFFRILDTPNGFRKSCGFENKFLVFYGGTIGLAQGLSTLIEAAKILNRHDDILFLLVGQGAERERLLTLTKMYGLRNVTFLEAQPREMMPEIVNAIDVGIISLRSLSVFRGVLPSKMFEYMACGKPLIASAEGNVAEVLKNGGCGLAVKPESPDQLANAILKLYGDRVLGRALGAKGRDYVVTFHSRDDIVVSLERALFALVK
jgi:glycosyltransferase involved in cell wall biosynthesis